MLEVPRSVTHISNLLYTNKVSMHISMASRPDPPLVRKPNTIQSKFGIAGRQFKQIRDGAIYYISIRRSTYFYASRLTATTSRASQSRPSTSPSLSTAEQDCTYHGNVGWRRAPASFFCRPNPSATSCTLAAWGRSCLLAKTNTGTLPRASSFINWCTSLPAIFNRSMSTRPCRGSNASTTLEFCFGRPRPTRSSPGSGM
jgi:hypothetical protein